LVSESLLEDGQPPHITLIYPFVDVATLAGEVVDEVERCCSGFRTFDFQVGHAVRFGEVVFVSPDPAEPFRDLLRALTSTEPPPPYPVTVTDTIPHLTIAFSSDPSELEEVSTRVAGSLPIRSRAAEAWLMAESTDGWSLERTFALGD
jgi:2'-5' RNA ligase